MAWGQLMLERENVLSALASHIVRQEEDRRRIDVGRGRDYGL